MSQSDEMTDIGVPEIFFREQGATPALMPDEIEWLADSKRCVYCGHLSCLHNGHCCAFCMVGDCECTEYPE